MARLRAQVGGTLSTAGQWSNTYEFILNAAVANQTTLQTIATAIHTALAASTPWKAGYCVDTNMVNVKLLNYPTNTGPSNLVATSAGAVVAGSAGAIHAPQVSVVASLRTAVAGRSYRGRLYIPYRGPNVNAGGQVNSTAQGAVNAHAAAFVGAVGAALASQALSASWVVWSPTKGTASSISAVLVGNQCDTIRHRNDNRAESYASFSPPSITLDAPDEPTQEQIQAVANRYIDGLVGPQGLETTLGIIAGAALTP